MNNKLNAHPLVVVVLIILASAFYSCKPGFIVQPSVNDKTYAEVDASGTHYYSYFKFLNTSSLPCNVSFEKSLQHIKLVSPLPLTLAPNASTEVKFEILDFKQSTPCPTPCIIEEIPLKAVWPQYSDPAYFVEQKPSVQWTAPVTRVNCWVPTAPPGGPGNYYQAPLCVYMSPQIGGGGTQYKWPQIGEIYNPNNFLIKVLVNDPSTAAYHCYYTSVPAGKDPATYFTWVDLPPGSSFDYGAAIKANYSASCLAANPNASIYILSPSGSFTPTPDKTVKWIAIRVELH